MSDRTIFIGDLHGCADETLALLERLQLTANDRVIFLGDYVDRGPENARCCDIVRHREQVQGRPAGILGNHEDTHLIHEEAHLKGRLGSIPPAHVATRAQLKLEHYDWFRTLPLFLRVPEHNVVAVHAGVFPGRTIEAQSPKHLLHVQMIKPYDLDRDGNLVVNTRSVWPSRVPEGESEWRFWTHFWDGPETIVFGHSVFDKPLVTDKVVGIDGGAVFGHQLHAYVLPEKVIVSVDAKKDYGGGRRGKDRPGGIMKFLVHGDVATYS